MIAATIRLRARQPTLLAGTLHDSRVRRVTRPPAPEVTVPVTSRRQANPTGSYASMSLNAPGGTGTGWPSIHCHISVRNSHSL